MPNIPIFRELVAIMIVFLVGVMAKYLQNKFAVCMVYIICRFVYEQNPIILIKVLAITTRCYSPPEFDQGYDVICDLAPPFLGLRKLLTFEVYSVPGKKKRPIKELSPPWPLKVLLNCVGIRPNVIKNSCLLASNY